MSNVPADLKYTKSHEWIRDEGDGTVTVGITDHAQELLGDLVYVELPEEGTEYAVEDACSVIESVKAASDLYSPVAGTITGANDALESTPELINSDPYGDGWILKMNITGGMDDLLDAAAYEEVLAAE